MRDQEIVNYLNSIDFSLANDQKTIENIFIEINPYSSDLICDPLASNSLEKLINLSNSKNLLYFIKSIKKNLIYKKLGSRIFERIFYRLFDLMYLENEYFEFKDFIDFVAADDCITCSNATHALRAVFMLLSGKKILKNDVIKYKILDCDPKINILDDAQNKTALPDLNNILKSEKKVLINTNINSNLKNDIQRETKTNSEYSKTIMNEYKDLFMEKLDKFTNNDSFITLGIFIIITKSQSLISKIIDQDLNIENIKNRSFFYEGICEVSSKKNLMKIYKLIKNSIMELSLEDKSSFFIQSFLKNFDQGIKILKKIDLEKFDENSNVILSLTMSLQRSKNFEEVKMLMKIFYKIEQDVFETFLLKKYGQIDTKYVDLIVNFMNMPKNYNYQVNSDFRRLFDKEWLKSGAGIKLVFGFIEGSEDSFYKSKFFNENIDLFWNAYKWKTGYNFAKLLVKNTQGHSKKKAYEILSKCKK